MNILGENIKRYRNHNFFTQQELAGFLGCPREMISYYENGSRTPGVDILLKISDLFGVELDGLLEDSREIVDEDLVLAFRRDENNLENLDEIASFKRIIKNYMKMERLSTENGF
ncbi:MAG: helix-turn-helix transcriptional regulator [Spirochaetes bacterium]|nr:helix-turn-helix transcriptional regulator [Spirochaetota bacterium]